QALSPYFNCPLYPASSCNSNDLLNNYMDFSQDACLFYFTKGQIVRMHAALNVLRSSLINQNALCNSIFSPSCSFNDVMIRYNPSSSSVYISDYKINDLLGLQIFNAMGQEVFHYQDINTDFLRIPVGNWSPGVYFITLVCQEAKKSFKIVIPS
ncbi:MAG: zinc-dependent metalloprotease, partial [Bacteroidota bacterium]